MTNAPVVLKFGGEALASPERIAAAARRVARRAERQPVVVVASARRGVTDHLLDLVRRVGQAPGLSPEPGLGARSAADRAVASGELVSAALLALALEHLGIRAEPLDAREAGLLSDGRFGDAALRTIRATRVQRLLSRGGVPVVTGFQGWHRGRVTTLGRGGSDITAVGLAAELGAERCEFVKGTAGLMTADPKLVPGARVIRAASHRFVAQLAEAGAKVLHPAAARAAEQHQIRLAFLSLDSDEVRTLVGGPRAAAGARAVASRPIGSDLLELSAIAEDLVEADELFASLRGSLAEIIGSSSEAMSVPGGIGIRVPVEQGPDALRRLHACFVATGCTGPLLSEAS